MSKFIKFFKEKDKQKHMLVATCSAIINPMFSLGLCIGKEYGDKCCPSNKWDWRDMLANGIGWAVGTTINILLKWGFGSL